MRSGNYGVIGHDCRGAVTDPVHPKDFVRAVLVDHDATVDQYFGAGFFRSLAARSSQHQNEE
jgi:hypothetical protein